MLASLAIRDIVLIERLDLAFHDGLTVLTGETGAGKSIILDALGFVLGARADRSLLRAGASQGSVTAIFDPPDQHPARAVLIEQSMPSENELVLRRLITADGRSRAFVNDEPISAQFLRRLGNALVEIHGQHDQRGLLDPAEHRDLLDAFAGILDQAKETAAGHGRWRAAVEQVAALEARLAESIREEDYLRHRERELADLAPAVGEEEELAAERSRLANRGKLQAAIDEAQASLVGQSGASDRLGTAERRLQRLAGLEESGLEPALEAIGRALIEVEEASGTLETVGRRLGEGADSLETVEARLFALRDAARKHRVPVDGLPALLEETQALLAAMERGGLDLVAARKLMADELAAFQAAARMLSAAREEAAGRLAEAMMLELAPLKLERARLQVALEPLAEKDWSSHGAERVSFEVSTNPGQPFGPLAKIASGGELSRLMLALKVVLARLDSVPTLVFDEVDSGIGGATADAVGERLARLGQERQVLVVTHAPQVAARANRHLTVTKSVVGEGTKVLVEQLDPGERPLEIARMLAGAEVTSEARAAASALLERAGRG